MPFVTLCLFCTIRVTILLLAITAAIDAIVTSDSRKVLSQSYDNAFPPPTMSPRPQHCYRKVEKCVALSSSQCLDVTLPYKFTSTNSVVSNYSLSDIHSYLSQWRGLRSIPQCWKALQSVLCASFFPRCDNEYNRVLMPTHEMCRFTRSPCRLIDLHYEWPEFLRCDNQIYFPPKCKNEYTDLKFNTSAVAKCAPPLVSSDDSNIWYPGIEGCALHCHNPIYTEEQHKKVSSFISHLATFSLITTLYAVLTFIIDWRSSNRYPAVIIFYLNMCFMIANFGWLLQSVLPKGKNEIICRSDNTTRYAEPGTPENFYCLLVFFLIYYFSMAALIWFVNLAYAWDLSFQTSSSQRDSINSKGAYFHMTAWSVPLMLTITILALGEVDGDWLRGICFVGFLKPVIRICFVLIPTTVALLIGCFYMFKAMHTLIRVKLMNKSQTTANKSRSKRILHMIIRIALFVTFAISAVICTYVCHIYEFTHLPLWKQTLNDYIICSLNMKPALYPTILEITEENSCKKEETPNLMYIYIQLVSFFGAGIMTSTWVWTNNSLAGWKRFIIRRLKPELNEPIRIKRHELISKMFNRRHQLSQGCYSPSIHSMHDDPVGMNLNSAASQDLSATWAAALPNFVYRRGGITGINGDTHYLPSFFGTTRHSSISDVSQQRSFDSYASQRRSLDSQMSLEHLELVAMARHQRRKTKKERERLLKAHNSHRAIPYNIPVRRGSDTSGSVMSAAFAARGLPNVLKLETKSTSTGDLIALAPLPPQMPYLAPHLAPSSLSFHPQCSQPFVVSKPVPRQRSAKPSNANFSFTHGINDQSNQLINPLIEKRRPDSCAPKIDNCVQNNHPVLSTANESNLHCSQQTPQSFATTNPLSNYSVTYLNSVNYTTPTSSLNYLNPLNSYYASFVPNNVQASSSFAGFPNFISPPQYSATPIPGMPYAQQFTYNGLSPAYNPLAAPHCANLHEIQSLIREREKYLSLTVPMDSSSEVGDNFFPIQLSDSEGLYSDRISRNEEIATAQRIVDEHIQKVEAAVEANKNKSQTKNQSVVGDVGDSMIGNVLELKKSKSSSKSEKRKKKKSSHRKHKSSTSSNTNGHVVNVGVNPSNDNEMNCVPDNHTNLNINETSVSKQESNEDVIR